MHAAGLTGDPVTVGLRLAIHNIMCSGRSYHLPMVTLALVVVALVVVFGAEFYWYRQSRGKIAIRIHVNGIRGKSSVVRLIAAGLRQGGIRTWAKVTGTLPRLVDENGNDVPIVR